MTVSSDRPIRLTTACAIVNEDRQVPLPLDEFARLCLSEILGESLIRTQGRPNPLLWALSWEHTMSDPIPGGPFPGVFNGTEAISPNGFASIVNYLQATAPEAA